MNFEERLIGWGSLVATIVVAFLIYWLEKRRSSENDAAQAREFLIQNRDEEKYLLLAAIASRLNNPMQHTRPIYSNFKKYPSSVQIEIVKLKCKMQIPPIKQWLKPCLIQMFADLKRFGFSTGDGYDIDIMANLLVIPFQNYKYSTPLNTIDFTIDHAECLFLGFNHAKPSNVYEFISAIMKGTIKRPKETPPFDWLFRKHCYDDNSGVWNWPWLMHLIYETHRLLSDITLSIALGKNPNVVGVKGVSARFRLLPDIETIEDFQYSVLLCLYLVYGYKLKY